MLVETLDRTDNSFLLRIAPASDSPLSLSISASAPLFPGRLECPSFDILSETTVEVLVAALIKARPLIDEQIRSQVDIGRNTDIRSR